MKKNEQIVKAYYIKYVARLCQKLLQNPDSHKRVEKLSEVLSRTKTEHPVRKALSYLINRILSGNKSEFYFGDFGKYEDRTFAKINLAQVYYSGLVMNSDKTVEKYTTDFVYGFDKDVQYFLRNYYNSRNITGVSVEDLKEIFDKFSLKDEIVSLDKIKKELPVTAPKKEVSYKKPVEMKKLRFPCVLFRKEHGEELDYFYKDGDTIKTSFQDYDRELIEGCLQGHKQVAFVGVKDKNIVRAYVATSRKKVVKGLLKGGEFSIPNAWRSVLESAYKINRSLGQLRPHIDLQVKKAIGVPYFELRSLLKRLIDEKQTADILFKNRFLDVDRILYKDCIIEGFYPRVNKVKALTVDDDELLETSYDKVTFEASDELLHKPCMAVIIKTVDGTKFTFFFR